MEKTMIDVLKGRLFDGLEIVRVKETNSKYTIVFRFDGSEAQADLPKSCSPGAHNAIADNAIITAMSSIYFNRGDFAKAKEWLDKIGTDTIQDRESRNGRKPVAGNCPTSLMVAGRRKGEMVMARKPTKQEERLMRRYPETQTFLWYNENPKGHITGDCSIRALAGGMGITWYEALDGLHSIERRYALSDIKAIGKYLESQGWVKHKQPRHDDGSKYTGSQFATWLSTNYPTGEIGTVICSVANHMFCIKPTFHGDGINCRYKVIDIWDSTSKCIGNYWTRGGVVT